MGEYADMMLDGTLCEGCGVYLGADSGYPMRCRSCRADRSREVQIADTKKKNGASKVSCPQCQKRVKEVGLKDHMRDAHGA